MKKALKIIIGIVLLVVVIGVVAISYYTGYAVFEGMTNAIPRATTLENQSIYISEYNEFANVNKPLDIKIPSSHYDYEIPAVYVEKSDSKGVAVIVHGMGGTKKSSSHVMQIFLDLGYSVIAYDQRNSGDNTALYSTFGVLESMDALDVVGYAHENLLNGGKLILWGESYGGASSAIALGRDESKIDYLVLECPVGKGYDMMEGILKEYADEAGIPLSYMIFCGETYTKFKLGFDYKDMDPAKWIESTTKPVLIFNSSIDKVTPAYMGQEIYEAISHNKKKIFTNDQYEHIEFPSEDPEAYKRMLEDFIVSY